MMTVRTSEELDEAARKFLALLKPRTSAATLVTFSGELGAGKTAFVKAIARALGIEETVTSPTFVLEKIYLLPEGKTFARLIHIDAYRLAQGNDLAALGFDELMRDRANLVLLEWPERVAEALPEEALRVSIEILPDESRRITV